MITGLDDPAAIDPNRFGAKAAALALARQGGLPVLPGFVVEAAASREHMKLGISALASRGSGGARLAVISESPPAAARLVAEGRRLSSALAVRSSAPIESNGAWAGAFTSYIGVTPEELPKAVAGCWASAFSVGAVAHQSQAGIEPGSISMAVLVQPAIDPAVGGVAEISADRTVWVEAVAGSPAPLLQGWVRGTVATRSPGEGWEGSEAIALVGLEVLDQIGAVLEAASKDYGFNRCEWGLAGSLWILQLSTAVDPAGLGRESVEAFLEQGFRHQGIAAAPGIGVGVRHHFDGAVSPTPSLGAVITAPVALASLSQLIWGAAGLVTDRGSPTAHVFEAARSLRIPAVCGVDLGSEADQIVAVDGYSGVVAVLPLGTQLIP